MTMGMVIIMMSVLSILGVATLSLTVSAYRVQISDKRVKSTFYVADSELDQAYGLIGTQIKAAIIAGNGAVNQKIQEEIEAEREDEILNPETHVPKWLKSDGAINEDYLLDQLKNNPNLLKILQTAYAQTMNLNVIGTVELTSHYEPIMGDVPDTITIDADNKQLFFETDPNDSTKNDMVIPLQFKVLHQAGDQQVIQQVKADFKIKVPDKIIGYQTAVNNVYLQDQPLWRTALTSYQDINFSGDFSIPSQQGITVQGDIFAKGTIPADLKDLKTFGGITAGKSSNNTKVTIKGNAYSNANLQVNSDNTTIRVTGNIYSDNLVLQKDTTNSKIVVNQDAYTRDDLEINGTTANLLIGGNYYGYSGGETGHDQSSSIVINSPDINQQNGSKVLVEGDSFLAGTVYINAGDPGDPDYQTGEGISVHGNYRAYGFLPTGDENKYSFRKVGNSLMLIDKWNNPDNDPLLGVDKAPLNVFEKALHFFTVAQELVSTNFLNTGYGSSSIVLNGNVLSTGAYIKNGSIEQSNYDIGAFGAQQVACQTAVQTNVTNNYGQGQVTANTADYFLSDRINLSSSLFTERNDTLQESPSLQEILVMSKNHDIALIGAGGVSTGLPADTITIDVRSKSIGGLILTSKQVIVRGEVDFHGSIIAGENIRVEDNYDKNFYADEKLVKQIIATKGLNDLFITPTDPVTGSVLVGPSLFNFEAGGGVPDPAINPYNDYITVTNWKKL